MTQFLKKFKYIEIEGMIVNYASSTTHPTFRQYDNVDLIDKDGTEIHMMNLLIPNRLHSKIKRDKLYKFRIMRVAVKNKMAGVLYAAEHEGQSFFYKEESQKLVKDYIYMNRGRGSIAQGTPGGYSVAAVGIGSILSMMLAATADGIFGQNFASFVFFATCIAVGYYFAEPLFLRGRYTRLDIFRSEIARAGLLDSDSLPNKY